MRNFEVTDKDTGKKYWISRSVAILAMVHVVDEPNGPKTRVSKVNDRKPNEIEESHTTMADSYSSEVVTTYTFENKDYVKNNYILVNKRGEGCPNYQGKWNLVCGYLDWDETLTMAATREVAEECGVYINPQKWCMRPKIDDAFIPGKQPQNVTILFDAYMTMEEFEAARQAPEINLFTEGENNEVADVDLMLLTKENIQMREWAFNHKRLLQHELDTIQWVEFVY